MPVEQYLADVIRPLLTKPDAAQISTSLDDMGMLLTVVLAPEDMGSVIGKQGETAKAIRHHLLPVKHVLLPECLIECDDNTNLLVALTLRCNELFVLYRLDE